MKLYKAIESYNTILEVFKEGVGDMPYIKVLAEALGVESKDIINIFANDAEPEVWNKLVQRLDVFLFANKGKAFEKEEDAGGETEEKCARGPARQSAGQTPAEGRLTGSGWTDTTQPEDIP